MLNDGVLLKEKTDEVLKLRQFLHIKFLSFV